MINFGGRKKQDEDSRFRRPPWDWATKQSAATIVLAAILGVSLMGGQMLVWSRTGKVVIQQQAIENGKKLIAKVTQEGLNHFLENKTITRYYFLESIDGTMGYMVLSLEPEVQQDGSWILNGKQIFHPEGSLELHENFRIANDLSWYQYKTSRRDLALGESVETEFQYKEKLFRGIITLPEGERTRDFLLPPLKTSLYPHLIMPSLLDFFSSVAALEGYEEGVMLALPVVDFQGDPRNLLHIRELWVKLGGEPPPEIRAATPDGRCVQVQWLESPRFQTILYDATHQLVWQHDLPEPASTIRKTTREELLETFPEVEQVLIQMFRMTIDG